eukprot:scaffold112565_cov34-Prasinocladus_malaysianus.AAC.1
MSVNNEYAIVQLYTPSINNIMGILQNRLAVMALCNTAHSSRNNGAKHIFCDYAANDDTHSGDDGVAKSFLTTASDYSPWPIYCFICRYFFTLERARRAY